MKSRPKCCGSTALSLSMVYRDGTKTYRCSNCGRLVLEDRRTEIAEAVRQKQKHEAEEIARIEKELGFR